MDSPLAHGDGLPGVGGGVAKVVVKLAPYIRVPGFVACGLGPTVPIFSFFANQDLGASSL